MKIFHQWGDGKYLKVLHRCLNLCRPHIYKIICTKNCVSWVFTPANTKEKATSTHQGKNVVMEIRGKNPQNPTLHFVPGARSVQQPWLPGLYHSHHQLARLQSAHRTLKSSRKSPQLGRFSSWSSRGSPGATIPMAIKTPCAGRAGRKQQRPGEARGLGMCHHSLWHPVWRRMQAPVAE